LKDKKNVDVVVYTGDTVPPETILATAKVRTIDKEVGQRWKGGCEELVGLIIS
jgi:hypothetical protein